MAITRREWILGGVILAQQAYIAVKSIDAADEGSTYSIPPSPNGEKCEHCYFFHEAAPEERRRFGITDKVRMGGCHFNPTTAQGISPPPTRFDNWCSKFKLRDAK